MKVFAFLVLMLIVKLSSMFKTENQGIYFRGLFCNLSEKYIFPNFSCRAKSFNRSTSTVTALVTAKKPMNDIFVRTFTILKNILHVSIAQLQISFDYKYGNIYRDVLHTPRFDVCQMIKAARDNRLLGELIMNPSDLAPSAFRDNVEQLIHECPYQVALDNS